MSEQPEGIEHSVDSGIADDDHEVGATDDDLQTPTTQRHDPDQPEEAMRDATEQARGEDD